MFKNKKVMGVVAISAILIIVSLFAAPAEAGKPWTITVTVRGTTDGPVKGATVELLNFTRHHLDTGITAGGGKVSFSGSYVQPSTKYWIKIGGVEMPGPVITDYRASLRITYITPL